jgi:hypothetical protein
VLRNKCLLFFVVVSAETAKDTWEKLRRCFMNALNRRRNKKIGDGAKKMVPWRYEFEMSFLLPSLNTKITQSNVQKEENLVDVQIDEQEMDEPEMNILYEIPEGQSNIKCEETLSEFDSHTQGYFSTKRKQSGRDSANQQMVNIKREETSPSSELDSHTQSYFPTIRKQSRRDSAIQQMVDVMNENSYLRQRRHEEKTTIRDMDETDIFFLSMTKMIKKLPSLEQAKIKLQLSQAVLQAQIALEEKQDRPQ